MKKETIKSAAISEAQLELVRMGKIFCKEETDYLELVNTINAFKELVFNASGIDLNKSAYRENIYAENGLSLGTVWAAACIDDLMRTKLFVKGLFAAINELRKKQFETIHIFYAGTGPFASLILPLLASFPQGSIALTLLEINKASYDSAQRTLAALGFDKYIYGAFNEDATQFQIDTSKRVDILLSETMQKALEGEQQVPIVFNLLSQLPAETILIPERIQLELGLMNLVKMNNRVEGTAEINYLKRLGNIVTLDKAFVNQSAHQPQADLRDTFPQVAFELAGQQDSDYSTLVILTEICTYQGSALKINESALTIPTVIRQLQGDEQKAYLQYTLGVQPKVELGIE